MRNITIILKKQLLDTLKNKTILIQFILFPVMTLIMESFIKIDGMPEHFFVKLFAVMYMGMAPLTATAAIISEEKEKNTLRVLMMANVKPYQYLMGVGIYVWAICMCGGVVMGCVAGFGGETMVMFLALMAVGFIVSIMLGAAIGVFAKDQMAATSIVMPCMMVLSFVPMLSMFNETIAKIAKITYTQQINILFGEMKPDVIESKNIVMILCNFLLFMVLFSVAYRKNGLE